VYVIVCLALVVFTPKTTKQQHATSCLAASHGMVVKLRLRLRDGLIVLLVTTSSLIYRDHEMHWGGGVGIR